MSDATSRVLDQERDRDKRLMDDILSTPNFLPTSPFMTPLQSTQSNDLLLNESGNDYKHNNQKTGLKQNNVIDQKIQDFDHQRRFERFLALSGIKRKSLKQKSRNASSIKITNVDSNDGDDGNRPGQSEPADDSMGSVHGDSVRYNLFPDSSDYSEADQDSSLIEDDNDNINPSADVLAEQDNNMDQDLFYAENREAFVYIGDGNQNAFVKEDSVNNDNDNKYSGFDDSENEVVYFAENYYEHTTIGGQEFPIGQNQNHKMPLSSNDTFKNFENHKNTEGIELIPEFQVPETPEFAVKYQPAGKFKDPLSLKYNGFKKLSMLGGQKYKNNVSCCSSKENVLIIGAKSELLFFNLHAQDEKINQYTIFSFDIRPPLTTDQQRENSTWPYYPHTINYLKIGEFLGHETLAVACDDGRVLIYSLDVLMHKIYTKNRSLFIMPALHILGVTVKPDYELHGSSSAWGIDMYDNMIAVSDNSRSVTLYYFDKFTKREYSVHTHEVLHNIPSISFITNDDTDEQTDIHLSVVSISGELLIFKFPILVNHGPTLEIDNDDSLFRRVFFKEPVVISRTILGDSVWTTAFVDSKYFKKVSSLEAMTGDPWIDQNEVIVPKILNESRILDAESDECYSSHLGLATNFHNFLVPSISFSQPKIQMASKSFTTLSDNYRRIKKIFDDYYHKKQRSKEKYYTSVNGKKYWEPISSTPQFDDKFLLVSTALKLGLFRANKLICNAAVPNVFQYKPLNDDLLHLNRLSLCLLIPELNCYVVGSQVGLVSIFRLTNYRGLHAMRQEYLIPNYGMLYLSGEFGMRTLMGLSYKKVSEDKFVLYLVYVDGLCLIYELSNDELERVGKVGDWCTS